MKPKECKKLIYLCNTKQNFRGATCSGMIKSLTVGSFSYYNKKRKVFTRKKDQSVRVI